MRLSAFIHDTLYEISLGVHLARARSRDLTAIAPSKIDDKSVSEKTYVDFDVAIVVSENDLTSKGGNAKVGAEIQVASVIRASVNAGGKIESGSKSSIEQTHRITFKVPIYMNAHFRDNPLAAADAAQLLTAHGIIEEN